jgi:hypothetical protein
MDGKLETLNIENVIRRRRSVDNSPDPKAMRLGSSWRDDDLRLAKAVRIKVYHKYRRRVCWPDRSYRKSCEEY